MTSLRAVPRPQRGIHRSPPGSCPVDTVPWLHSPSLGNRAPAIMSTSAPSAVTGRPGAWTGLCHLAGNFNDQTGTCTFFLFSFLMYLEKVLCCVLSLNRVRGLPDGPCNRAVS